MKNPIETDKIIFLTDRHESTSLNTFYQTIDLVIEKKSTLIIEEIPFRSAKF